MLRKRVDGGGPARGKQTPTAGIWTRFESRQINAVIGAAEAPRRHPKWQGGGGTAQHAALLQGCPAATRNHAKCVAAAFRGLVYTLVSCLGSEPSDECIAEGS